ncbi:MULTISPECIES: glycosyltransferase family 4 protein [unclassified Microbacterium]|uniref:glycosyltransferase family 4 protein n=1 Tax=unclassified Microbacterium TaxID=2609290 RepID=UPI0018DFDD72|nr:glycosyltransferase family 4 protein [Microbacterium sp. MAH-37]
MVTSGSTATAFLRGYIDYLVADGWQVALICSNGPGVAEMAKAAGARYFPLEMNRDPSPLKDMASLLSAFALLRRLRPDAVVYATPKAALIGALASYIAGVPQRVYEVWGLRLETSRGLARRLFAVFEKLTVDLSTRVIANSRSLAERMRDLGVAGRAPVLVLGAGSSHGVDTERFSARASMPLLDETLSRELAESDAPIVGFVGRLNPDKGIDVLTEAIKLCVDRGVSLQVLIVGRADGAAVTPLVRAGQGKAVVHIAGFVTDPRACFKAMDILVLPSRREGFPNVVLEAAGMEVPAIVSDATGSIDSVVHGVTGIVTPTGDSGALADAIIRLVDDTGLRRSMGQAARLRAVNEFQPRQVWAAHSDAWRA